MVVLAGNHDSVATLNESCATFWRFSNTTVIASAGYAPRLLHRRDGSPSAMLYPIPFAPYTVRQDYPAKQQQLLHAIADYYQQRHQEACQLRGERKLPVIATGHLTAISAAKAMQFDGIYIGTLDAFPAAAFPRGLYRIGTFTARSNRRLEHIHIAAHPSPSALMECSRFHHVHRPSGRGNGRMPKIVCAV